MSILLLLRAELKTMQLFSIFQLFLQTMLCHHLLRKNAARKVIFIHQTSHLLQLSSCTMQEMFHRHHPAVGACPVGSIHDDVANVATRQLVTLRQHCQIQLWGERNLKRKQCLPDTQAICFIREGKVDRKLQSASESFI